MYQIVVELFGQKCLQNSQRSSHLGDLRLQPRDVLLEVGDELVELGLGLARPRPHGLGRVLRLLALLDEAEVLVLQVREDREQLLGLTEEQADFFLKFCWIVRKIFLLLGTGNNSWFFSSRRVLHKASCFIPK